MQLESFVPSAPLRPFVEKYLVVRSQDGMVNRLLPSSAPVLAVRLHGAVSHLTGGEAQELPRTGISGIADEPRTVRYAPGSATLLVLFRDGGAAGFWNAPMNELRGNTVALENLSSTAEVQELEDKLSEASDRSRIALVEAFLLTQRTGSEDRLVSEAVRRIRAARGRLTNRQLLEGLPVNLDSLEKRFRRRVGTSPKRFARIIRVRSLIDGYSPEVTLTDAAYQAGYYDQSHFIRDFRSLTGQAPREFFLAGPRW